MYDILKKAPTGKSVGVFSRRYSEKCILKENITYTNTNRDFFLKSVLFILQNQDTFLLFSKKDRGDFPLPPSLVTCLNPYRPPSLTALDNWYGKYFKSQSVSI